MTAADFELHYGVLPEPMLLTSVTGRIRAANEAAARLLLCNAADLAHSSLTDLAAEPPETVARILARFARSGQLVPAALTLKTGSATAIFRIAGARLRVQGEPELLLRLQSQKDAVRRFHSLNERITLLNREVFDRTQFAQAAGLLSAIISSSEDAIISKDLNGVITSWNTAAERMFGYTPAEAIGENIVNLILPPDRLDEEPQILNRLRRGERVEHFDTIRMRKDGSRLHVSLTISPVKAPDGHIVGASKIVRDITMRVKQEKALVDANEALQRANADLEQFAYSASHDLQEPLRIVATYSELLKRRFGGQLGPAGDLMIGFTVEAATRMQTLLNDLRVYTQISTDSRDPTTDVDANEVLQKALGNLNLAMKESGAAVTSTALPHVLIFEFELEQLFQNLIGNAIRYRREEPPRIHVAAEMHASAWRFSVADNGIGIDPKFKDQIFGIFKRLHTSAEYPGTGMGLAICQRIVERLGGRIWVESELGRGSTFYFTIPCPERPDPFEHSCYQQPGRNGTVG